MYVLMIAKVMVRNGVADMPLADMLCARHAISLLLTISFAQVGAHLEVASASRISLVRTVRLVSSIMLEPEPFIHS